MKLTKTQLKEIIREELDSLTEVRFDISKPYGLWIIVPEDEDKVIFVKRGVNVMELERGQQLNSMISALTKAKKHLEDFR
jgi:hypothetical protein